MTPRRVHERALATLLRRGYDSVQLTQFDNGYSLELIDCRGAALPTSGDLWWGACPPQHTELRSGLPEPRYPVVRIPAG